MSSARLTIHVCNYISLFLYITSSCLLKYDIILENIMLEDFIQVPEVGKQVFVKIVIILSFLINVFSVTFHIQVLFKITFK